MSFGLNGDISYNRFDNEDAGGKIEINFNDEAETKPRPLARLNCLQDRCSRCGRRELIEVLGTVMLTALVAVIIVMGTTQHKYPEDSLTTTQQTTSVNFAKNMNNSIHTVKTVQPPAASPTTSRTPSSTSSTKALSTSSTVSRSSPAGTSTLAAIQSTHPTTSAAASAGTTSSTTPSNQPATPTSCPENYIEDPMTGNCYGFITQWRSRSAARQLCSRNSAKLVSIQTEAEQKFLMRQADNVADTRSARCDYWTCATDEGQEGHWVWETTGQNLTYGNWFPGEPSNGGDGGEHCMQLRMVYNWTWNDFPCSGPTSCVICEIEL